MKKIVLTALAVVFSVIFAACDNPADGNGNDHTETTENINFGKITATSTQEEVTNIIKLSLELLQSQTQNIINKLTEYQTSLQAQLQGKRPGTISYDILLDKINAVKSIINLEGQIKSAQQNRFTPAGLEDMNSYYALLTERSGDMLLFGDSSKTDKDKEIFVKKILAQQGAIDLYGRDIIGDKDRTTKVNALDLDRKNIMELEHENGNAYSLPDPRTNLYGLIGRLDSENKATLNTIWGQYAPLFEGQTEDLAQYAAVLGNAIALGKTTTLPRSAAQYSAASLDVAEMVKEINAAPEMGR
jgi:predicted small secreted protein